MIKKILIGIGVIIAGVLIAAAFQPSDFRIHRSASMKAAPAKVFAYMNDFHNWQAWSPWEKKDPAMTRTHSGSASGVGAVYEWKGNSDVGSGRMEIMESVAPSRILIKLQFFEPMAETHSTVFTIEAKDGGSEVGWTMEGPMNYIAKVMCLFMSMDKMVGGDFEKGLANLKAIVEPAA